MNTIPKLNKAKNKNGITNKAYNELMIMYFAMYLILFFIDNFNIHGNTLKVKLIINTNKTFKTILKI